MTRYEELSKGLEGLDEAKKVFIFSLLKDFIFLEEQIENLRKYPRYTINPKDPYKQIKLPVHDMLKDYQAQKNDIATKILRALDVDEIQADSPLLKALARFN